jgi:zinc transporter, ZIP family
VLEAAAWGLLGGSSLVIGALIGVYARLPHWVIGLVLGFGAGALISAVSFELADEALRVGGADSFAAGLAVGALTFYVGDTWIARRGAEGRQRTPALREMEPGATTSSALLFGALLDGIPESAVIGLTLLETGEVGIAVLVAVFIANLPEAVGGASGMTAMAGSSRLTALTLWALVAVAGAVASGLGFAVLDGASEDLIGFIQAFAAGSLLTMLADEMFPAAHAEADPAAHPATPPWSGRAVGLLTVLGFAVAFGISVTE